MEKIKQKQEAKWNYFFLFHNSSNQLIWLCPEHTKLDSVKNMKRKLLKTRLKPIRGFTLKQALSSGCLSLQRKEDEILLPAKDATRPKLRGH